jgi:hypothetical protein
MWEQYTIRQIQDVGDSWEVLSSNRAVPFPIGHEFFDLVFDDNWCGTGRQIQWHAYSPDLTPSNLLV